MADADKVDTTPATDTGATGEPAIKDVTQSPADNTPDIATLQAQLEKLEGEVASKDKSYSELRRVYNQRDAEIVRLRSVQQVPTQLPDDNGNTGTFTHADRENLDVIKFKQDNPDYGDYWNDIQAVIDDPVRVRDVAVPSSDGLGVDTGRSLKMAYLQVKNARFEDARRVADAEKAKLDAQKNANNSRALISGVGATGTGSNISSIDLTELEKLSADEMLKRNLVPIDSTDPPRMRKK